VSHVNSSSQETQIKFHLFSLKSTVIFVTVFNIMNRGAQIPDTRLPHQQNFVRKHLIFVDPQYVTPSHARILRWLLDFGKIVYPWIFNKNPLTRKMFWLSFPLNCFCAATHVMSFNTEMLCLMTWIWKTDPQTDCPQQCASITATNVA
jgi:hypothetical protein